jgi:cellulose synthase/poly-beta-1,6-N-acetylglucosamine synthase-like glycosyltransferase
VLRALRGWDPWNVTEDADMGVRLARHGYRATVIASSTFEEAPNRPRAWIYQRTRWTKGYILTWWLHTCRPRVLLREAGLAHFLVFNALVGGAPVAALALPILLASLALHVSALWGAATEPTGILMLDTAVLFLGVGAALWLALLGVRRRSVWDYLSAVAWMPVYWLLSSVAAVRAVIQLAGAPHLWEKTDHHLPRGARRSLARGRRAGPR